MAPGNGGRVFPPRDPARQLYRAPGGPVPPRPGGLLPWETRAFQETQAAARAIGSINIKSIVTCNVANEHADLQPCIQDVSGAEVAST